MLKGMSDYSVSSSPGNLASCKKTAVSLPSEYTKRWCLEEEQQRMRRDPKEIEEVALPQVYNDSALKRNQKLHLVRDVKSRGMLSATLSPLEHVGLFLRTNPKECCDWYWMRDDRTPTVCLLLVCDCCLSDESKSPALKVRIRLLRRRLNCGTHFPSRLPQQTCVTVSTRFECHCP